MALGILGVGMSREEATKHFKAAYASALDAQSLIAQYPKSAAQIDAYTNYKNLSTGFSQLWAEVTAASEGLTRYGTYADQADQYKAYFEQLVQYLMEARNQIGETTSEEKTDIPPLDLPGLNPPDKTEIPWVTIGIVVAVGAVLWFATRSTSSAIAGLRKRRRRRK